MMERERVFEVEESTGVWPTAAEPVAVAPDVVFGGPEVVLMAGPCSDQR